MNKQNLLFTIVGLLAGFIAGFFLANSINRNSSMQPSISPPIANAPSLNTQNNSQTQSVSIKDSEGAMIPEVSQTLDKAQNEPNNFQAQIKAGQMYARIQNAEKANEYLTKAAQIQQGSFQELATLGNGYFDIRNFEEAEKWYSLALEKNPDDVDVRTDLGSTFMERSLPDIDRAIKEYKTSLEKDPKHENTLFNLSVAQMRKGDFQASQDTLTQLEKFNPQSPLVPRLKEKLAQPVAK